MPFLALVVALLACLVAPPVASAAPTVVFTEPAGDTIAVGSPSVTVDASDLTGIDRCLLTIDGGPNIGADRVAPYQWTIDTSAWTDGSAHFLRAQCYAADKATSTSLRKDVTAVAGPSAAFTVTQDKSTRIHLDATGSSAGTYDWTVDGAPAGSGQTDDVVTTIGDHDIGLTVTSASGATATTHQTFTTIWRGYPYTAQVDEYGPNPGGLDPVGPWRRLDAIAGTGDWTADGHLVVHQGDHPSDSGGDRVGLNLNEAFTPALDLMGNAGHTTRFYRIEFNLPSTNTFPLVGYNNFVEWRGGSWTSLKIAPNGGGTNIRVVFTPKVLGVAQPVVVVDDHAMTPDHWENYVLEVMPSSDPAVGYVRVWRDGICRSCGTAQADAEGRIFGATQKSDADGKVWPTTLEQQLYRHPDVVPVGYMDIRNTEIGPTLDSVTDGGGGSTPAPAC